MSSGSGNIDYELAREDYLYRILRCPAAIGVVEYGEIKYPGISDIDWIIILEDDYKGRENDLLKLSSNMPQNTLLAFQHNPLFVPLSACDHLTEFLISDSQKLIYFKKKSKYKIFREFKESENEFLRDMTISYDFITRIKKWTNNKSFYKFDIVRQIAILKSIGNFILLPTLLPINKDLINYKDEIDQLRCDFIYKKKLEKNILGKQKEKGLSIIDVIETFFSNEFNKRFKITDPPEVQVLHKNGNRIYFNENPKNSDNISIAKSYAFIPLFYFTQLEKFNVKMPCKIRILSQGQRLPIEITAYMERKVSTFILIYKFLKKCELNVGIVADFGCENIFIQPFYHKIIKKLKYAVNKVLTRVEWK